MLGIQVAFLRRPPSAGNSSHRGPSATVSMPRRLAEDLADAGP